MKCCQPATGTLMSVKVFLDTDIDDALCLAYLLLHPNCDLLGITTVTGEAEKRAMLASAMCRPAKALRCPSVFGVDHQFRSQRWQVDSTLHRDCGLLQAPWPGISLGASHVFRRQPAGKRIAAGDPFPRVCVRSRLGRAERQSDHLGSKLHSRQ